MNHLNTYRREGDKDKAIAGRVLELQTVATSKQLQGDIQGVTAAEKGQRELLQVALTCSALLPNSPEKNVKCDQNIV